MLRFEASRYDAIVMLLLIMLLLLPSHGPCNGCVGFMQSALRNFVEKQAGRSLKIVGWQGFVLKWIQIAVPLSEVCDLPPKVGGVDHVVVLAGSCPQFSRNTFPTMPLV